jgi:hypothetical protein
MPTSLQDTNAWSIDDWRNWLNLVIAGLPLPPLVIRRDGDIIEGLIEIYKLLDSGIGRRRFSDAVGQAIQSTPQLVENHSELYILLQLCTVLRPFAAKEVCRRLVFEGHLRYVRHDGHSIHQLALQVAAKYEVDDDLLLYADRLLRTTRDQAEAFTTFRVIATRNRILPIDLLCAFVARVPEASDVATLLISGFASRYGYMPLLDWYLGRRAPAPDSDFRQTLARLLSGADILLNPVADGNDIDRTLLSAVVTSDSRLLTASELLATARTSRVDAVVAAAALSYIWSRPGAKQELVFISGADIPPNALRDSAGESIIMVRNTTATFAPRVEVAVEQIFLMVSGDIPPLPESLVAPGPAVSDSGD